MSSSPSSPRSSASSSSSSSSGSSPSGAGATVPIGRPEVDEYGAFYRGYVDRASRRLEGLQETEPAGDILQVLEAQLSDVRRLVEEIPPERETFRYAPGKWSLRQLFGHLGDGERVFGFRALAFARGDAQPLPGMDEGLWMDGIDFDRFELPSLAEGLLLARASNLAFLGRLDTPHWIRRGTANGTEFSVRALAFILAGHLDHHLGIVRERYLG